MMDKRNTELKTDNAFEQINKEDQRDFVNAHNNCALCGTALDLQHVFLVDATSIKEEAFCPECDMRTRAKIYTIN